MKGLTVDQQALILQRGIGHLTYSDNEPVPAVLLNSGAFPLSNEFY
jgi:hypothetical protein